MHDPGILNAHVGIFSVNTLITIFILKMAYNSAEVCELAHIKLKCTKFMLKIWLDVMFRKQIFV